MDIYFRQQIDNTQVRRLSDPRRRREQRLVLVAGGVLFLLLFSYAWMRFDSVRLGYQLEAARQQEAQLEQWNRGLELQQAALRNPERIYGLAQARLGMQNPLPGQILALDTAPAPQMQTPAPVVASLRR